MPVTFEQALEIVKACVVPAMAWAVRQLTLILTQLKILNGRMGKMETWQDGHEHLDRERFDSLQRELDIQGKRCVEHIRKRDRGAS